MDGYPIQQFLRTYWRPMWVIGVGIPPLVPFARLWIAETPTNLLTGMADYFGVVWLLASPCVALIAVGFSDLDVRQKIAAMIGTACVQTVLFLSAYVVTGHGL